ncbi:MAG: cytochrome-c peroxidase [Flavobacteriales bacterium]
MKKAILVMSIIGLGLYSCKKDEPDETSTAVVNLDQTEYELDLGAFPPPITPQGFQLTEAKVALGRMLFYEPRLSSLNNQSCASCHKQEDAFTDLMQFSVGSEGDVGDIQAMAIINLAWNSNGFFWDGRSPNLAHQALEPIQNPVEMAETHANVISKLNEDQDYKDQFIRAFGDGEITPERMGKAMEQFMMTLVSNNSKYDKYLAGEVQLTPSEARGRDLFFTEYNEFFPESSGADCAHCHGNFNFENDLYMNNGLDEEADFTHLGRYNVTGLEQDKARFKVTTLRNIELTPPYMHDGRFQTLEEVVDHYNDGIQVSPSLDQALLATTSTGLMLTDQDKVDLVNFLKTLTDEDFITNPEFANPF